LSKKTLKQLLLNKCEEQRGLSSKLAEIAQYSSGGNFVRVLKDPKKEFEKLHGLVDVVRYLFPNEEKELLGEYAITLDPNKMTARHMLEYLDQHRITNVKRTLINKMLNSTNEASKEWARLYDIDDSYVRKDLTFDETYNEYGGGYKPKSVETEVGAKLFKGYCLLDEQMFNILDQTIYGLEMKIMRITDDYIREMYYARFMILSIAVTVSKNRIDEARDMCHKMINNVNDNYYRALACLHLGNTYLLQSFETSNKIYVKGLEYANEDSRGEMVRLNLQRSINFLDNLYKKQPRYLNINSTHAADIHEIAFYYIQHKQYFKAKELLDKLDFDLLNDVQKAFNQYYRGLMGDSIKHFSRSITWFKKAGDFYFRSFPILELEKLGVDKNLIEALAV
jgi:hypothetical protein